MEPKDRLKASDFPPEVLRLFDGFVHGTRTRREFLDGAAKFAVGGFTAAAMLEALQPNFAWAQQVKKDDSRIKTEWVDYDSPQGHGKMRGYLVKPANASGCAGSRNSAITAEASSTSPRPSSQPPSDWPMPRKLKRTAR